MKIALVGASGFVGGHILRVLRAAGEDVRAVVRNPRFSPNDPNRRLADASDVSSMRDALAGCSHVVHSVVGSPAVILSTLAPVYAAAEAVGVRRFVYMSTGVVHGLSPEPGTNEASPLTVRHAFPYNTAKVRAERKLRRLRARGTVELVMLRPTIVYGPGSRWVFNFADSLRDGSAYLVDGGRGVCNSIYVDNLAHAVQLALTAPGIDGEAFLLRDAEPVTWCDLYRPIAQALGFELDAIPSFSPPELPLGFRNQFIEPIRSSELGQALLARVPSLPKAVVRRAYCVARDIVANASPGAGTVGATVPVVSEEIAALHRCRWRLPQEKARRLLGYAPPVTFDEGCRRSVDWIEARGRS